MSQMPTFFGGIISCFTFDPLLFELNHYVKKLAKINAKKDSYTSQKEDVERRISRVDSLKKSAKSIYDSKKICVVSLRSVLRTRVYEEQFKAEIGGTS
jgi:hypothetical protein